MNIREEFIRENTDYIIHNLNDMLAVAATYDVVDFDKQEYGGLIEDELDRDQRVTKTLLARYAESRYSAEDMTPDIAESFSSTHEPFAGEAEQLSGYYGRDDEFDDDQPDEDRYLDY